MQKSSCMVECIHSGAPRKHCLLKRTKLADVTLVSNGDPPELSKGVSAKRRERLLNDEKARVAKELVLMVMKKAKVANKWETMNANEWEKAKVEAKVADELQREYKGRTRQDNPEITRKSVRWADKLEGGVAVKRDY